MEMKTKGSVSVSNLFSYKKIRKIRTKKKVAVVPTVLSVKASKIPPAKKAARKTQLFRVRTAQRISAPTRSGSDVKDDSKKSDAISTARRIFSFI